MSNRKLFLTLLLIGSAVLTVQMGQLYAGPVFPPKIRVTPHAGGHQLNRGSSKLFVPPTSSMQFRSGKDGIVLDIYDQEGKLSRSLQAKTFDYLGKTINPSGAGQLNITGQKNASGLLVLPRGRVWAGKTYYDLNGELGRRIWKNSESPHDASAVSKEDFKAGEKKISPQSEAESVDPLQEMAAGITAISLACATGEKFSKESPGGKLPLCEKLSKEIAEFMANMSKGHHIEKADFR